MFNISLKHTSYSLAANLQSFSFNLSIHVVRENMLLDQVLLCSNGRLLKLFSLETKLQTYTADILAVSVVKMLTCDY